LSKAEGNQTQHATSTLVIGVVLSVSLLGEREDAMFRGNTQNRGVFETAGLPKFSKVKWSFHTGGMVIGSPTVTGGVVSMGSDDGNFYAIDEGTGVQKWKFAAKTRVPSTAGGNIYALM
jgi:hypothetical protein